MNKISVIIHTYNNEKIIAECLEAVKNFDEIIICDMYSSDKTLEIAKKYNCKIVMHEKTEIVEPARNFAISQASNEWVLYYKIRKKIRYIWAKRNTLTAQNLRRNIYNSQRGKKFSIYSP